VNIKKTKDLFSRKLNIEEPYNEMINVLESAKELLSLEENDFSWSFWNDMHEANIEIDSIINILSKKILPNKNKISVLFAPTGPIQEVSLSSGWGETFIKLSEKYDQIENILWSK
jgi:hypothetical protein